MTTGLTPPAAAEVVRDKPTETPAKPASLLETGLARKPEPESRPDEFEDDDADTTDDAQTAVARVEAEARKVEAEARKVEAEARKVEALAKVEALLQDGICRKLGAIIKAIGSNRSDAYDAVRVLKFRGLVVYRAIMGSGAVADMGYKWASEAERALIPTAKSIAVPTFDAVALRQKVESVVRTGMSYDLREVTLSARATVPYADTENVRQALADLEAAGKVKAITFGTRERFSKADPPAVEALG